MKDKYFLVFTKRGIDRMLKSHPTSLKAGERAVQVDFEVSDEVFHPVKIPTMKLVVPTEAITREFTAEQVEEPEVEGAEVL